MVSQYEETTRLVQAAQAGNEAALEGLFARYLPRVRAIVPLLMGKRLREMTEYDDVVQDSLLAAFTSLHAFEQGSEGKFRKWLASIVENNVRQQARRLRARKRGEGCRGTLDGHGAGGLVESILAGKSPLPQEIAELRELQDRLETALLGLDERSRKVIVYRRQCGMSYEEIAEDMGIASAESARSVFSRALNRLSKALTSKQ